MYGYPQKNDATTRDSLVKQATQGGFAIAGGVALLIFKAIAAIPVLGALVGVAMLVSGIVLRSKGSKGDNLSSLALIILGGVSVATLIPGVAGVASTMLMLSGIGLIGFGAWKLWSYYRNLKERTR